jgi:hypothetical protein
MPYLDENGNEIGAAPQRAPVYLNDQGEPLATPQSAGRYGAGQWSGQSYIDAVHRVADWLPEIGGAAGGAIGAAGGTVGGVGVGGVPGAIGGAALGGSAGEAAKQLYNQATGRAAPPTSDAAATGIAKEGAVQGAAEATGQIAGRVLSKAAPWLMQSAVKPTLATLKDYSTTAPKLVRTLLDEGVNVSRGGLAKLDALLGATNKQIADAVATAKGSVEKSDVLGRLGQTYERFGKGLDAREARQAITKEGEKLIDHPEFAKDAMTVPQAQDLKRGIYQEIKDSYGTLSGPAKEAKKAIARGLKEEVAGAVPEITKLNARDAQLMAAEEAVGRRVSVAGNRDPVGFAWAASGHPATFIAALMDRHPVVKSMLANAMWKSASAVTGVSPQVIRAAVHALVTDDFEQEPAPQ